MSDIFLKGLLTVFSFTFYILKLLWKVIWARVRAKAFKTVVAGMYCLRLWSWMRRQLNHLLTTSFVNFDAFTTDHTGLCIYSFASAWHYRKAFVVTGCKYSDGGLKRVDSSPSSAPLPNSATSLVDQANLVENWYKDGDKMLSKTIQQVWLGCM